MKLEAGKKYTDRRGRVYGPLVRVDVSCGGLFGENREDYAWYGDGQRSPGRELPSDLVAEYVEPAQAEPEYRLLKDGEPFQDGDEYLDIDAKWCKAPASENRTFNPQIYFPHRRLVKADETKAAEQPAPVESPDDLVIQDRIPARAGIDFGWNVSVSEFADHKPSIANKWAISPAYAGRIHGAIGGPHGDSKLRLVVMCYRKDLPALESPDDWVILDPVVYADHVPRVGVDQFQGWDDSWTTQETYHSKDAIGKWHTATGGNQTRCRRKDLPPVPPAEPEFPQYIIYATGGTFADCAYIVRTSEDDAYSVLANGKRGVDFKWVAYKANSLKSGVWKRVTEKEAEKLVSRTRTVVLKEWLCWEDAEPETVTLHWCSTSPADETDQFSAWNNAVETGNTRTVEIPVT